MPTSFQDGLNSLQVKTSYFELSASGSQWFMFTLVFVFAFVVIKALPLLRFGK